MRLSLPVLAGLLAALAGWPAAAQDRPPIFPTRDAAVTYRYSGGQEDGQEVRTAWLAAERRLRADHAGRGESLLADLRAGTVVVLSHARRAASAAPRGVPLGPMLLGAGLIPEEARLARGPGARPERVAGQECTPWRFDVSGVRGAEAVRGEYLACVAADGVVLRLRAPGGVGAIEATRVEYASQDPARFRPPPDYRREGEPR